MLTAPGEAALKPSNFAWRLMRDRLLSEEQARNAHREGLERRQPFVRYLVEEAQLDSGHAALAAADEFGGPLTEPGCRRSCRPPSEPGR